MKRCVKCNQSSDEVKFYKQKNGNLLNYCAACVNKRHGEARRRRLEYHRARERAYSKEYYQKNKQRVIDRVTKRRGRKVSAKGEYTGVEFNALVARFDNHCYYCAKKFPALTADHYIPLSKGGDNNIANIVPACLTCNLSKNVKMPWEFKPGEGITPKLAEQWLQENL